MNNLSEKLSVPDSSRGERLDRYLHSSFPKFSRNTIAEQCRRGRVLVDGKRALPGYILAGGERIEISFSTVQARPEVAKAAPAPAIHYEDDYLLVIEKPRGMPSIVLAEDDLVTVADHLVNICSRCLFAGEDLREGGLVQRLDTFSSGLILAAKDRETWERLREELTRGNIKKSYLALVEGAFSGSLKKTLYLKASGKRVSVAEEPKEDYEETRSEIDGISSKAEKPSLVRVTAPLAKRHQVRAHLGYLGFPLVGDALYGATSNLGEFLGSDVPGFFLHAEWVEFKHPISGVTISLRSKHEYQNRF